MDIFKMILGLLGGLALFLYGMNMMSTNLEAVAGNRMKKLIDRLTTNRFLGVFVGFLITAVIQSSSATTVMVVGFVNAKLMELKQAVWVIMGANIGTTVTGLLIALDIGAIAPIIAFIGVIMVVFFKNRIVKNIGSIIAGLGILFLGMEMMGSAMEPLREYDAFVNLMTQFSNPLLGILAGAVFTAIIQSSSASVGILQALANSGAIGLDSAVYVLFGQNIGTCITAVLAAIGANRNAKRTTVVHLMFNVIGTIVFTVICLVTPFTDFMVSLFRSNPSAQIAVTHTTFNVTTTILLLPFGTLMARFATFILPDKKSGKKNAVDHWFEEITQSRHVLGSTAVAMESISADIDEMFSLARRNVEASFDELLTLDISDKEHIERREDKIDHLNYVISQKITKVNAVEQNFGEAETLSAYFRIIGNIERIGDHAMNFAGYAALAATKEFVFSDQSRGEIAAMKESCLAAMDKLIEAESAWNVSVLEEIENYELANDGEVRAARERLTRGVKDGTENADTAVAYSEFLSDYERIGDHMLNIAQEQAAVIGKKEERAPEEAPAT